jgi:hypothetical protein
MFLSIFLIFGCVMSLCYIAVIQLGRDVGVNDGICMVFHYYDRSV